MSRKYKPALLLKSNKRLELSYLWRLPDGAERTEENSGCIFSGNTLFDNGKAIELNIEILINDGSCATITSAKRRALVTLGMLMTIRCITSNF